MNDGIEVLPCPLGARLRLRVKPGARKTGIIGIHDGALKVAVAAAPERGKANRAVVELLAETLGLPASAVTIASGESSRNKTVEVASDPSYVVEALTRALEDLH